MAHAFGPAVLVTLRLVIALLDVENALLLADRMISPKGAVLSGATQT